MKEISFIDLFAGIGGFRIAMQNCGAKCVFSSEIDLNAQKTYTANFHEKPYGDITKQETKDSIPQDFDVLCAGFPCQAFSVAGYRKGFEDARGTLFFDLLDVVKARKPKVIFLENVKNLLTHDNGKTFATIKTSLENENYIVFHKVMNALEYANIPQNRERIFIVCFHKDKVANYDKFKFPEKISLAKEIGSCIDYQEQDAKLFYTDKTLHIEEIRQSVVSKKTIYQWRRRYVRENKSNVCPTLTANMGTGGHNVPLILTDYGIRKLSARECLNFQGFPQDFVFPNDIPNSAKYKQAGNSVVVPLVERVCKQIMLILQENL